ncbi:MAG: hypothetical protein Q9203_007765, partial [Teloschistes exilis]
PFFGAMGCTSAIVFTCFGAAYGTAKSGVGISAMGVLRPDLIVKSALLTLPLPILEYPSKYTLRHRADASSNRHRSRHHGRYHRYLRPRRLRSHLRRP